MHALKFVSILLLISGALIFAAGLFLYWTTDPISGWAGGLIVIGLLFLLGSIIMLCVSLQYDMEPLSQRLHTAI